MASLMPIAFNFTNPAATFDQKVHLMLCNFNVQTHPHRHLTPRYMQRDIAPLLGRKRPSPLIPQDIQGHIEPTTLMERIGDREAPCLWSTHEELISRRCPIYPHRCLRWTSLQPLWMVSSMSLMTSTSSTPTLASTLTSTTTSTASCMIECSLEVSQQVICFSLSLP